MEGDDEVDEACKQAFGNDCMFLDKLREIIKPRGLRTQLATDQMVCQNSVNLGIPIARVRKQNPRARPIYPISGRIHIVIDFRLMKIAYWVYRNFLSACLCVKGSTECRGAYVYSVRMKPNNAVPRFAAQLFGKTSGRHKNTAPIR